MMVLILRRVGNLLPTGTLFPHQIVCSIVRPWVTSYPPYDPYISHPTVTNPVRNKLRTLRWLCHNPDAGFNAWVYHVIF